MGKDFYENSRKAKDIFDMASELLSLDMRKLCFEKNDLLDKTEYTQGGFGNCQYGSRACIKRMGDDCGRYSGIELRRILRGSIGRSIFLQKTQF